MPPASRLPAASRKSPASGKSPVSRSYHDACAVAHALELFGDRWALLVMRELMLGPRRFGDLRADLPGLSANVLTRRLQELEAAGVLVRRVLAPPASVPVYELTAWGYESEPILQAMGRWAARSPGHDPLQALSAVSLMLSLRTMLDAERARQLDAQVGFRLGAHGFVARLSGRRLAIERNPDGPAGVEAMNAAGALDVVFTAAAPVLAAAIYGGRPMAALIEEGVLSIDGDRALAERFVTLFRLPAKVAGRAAVASPAGRPGPARPIRSARPAGVRRGAAGGPR